MQTPGPAAKACLAAASNLRQNTVLAGGLPIAAACLCMVRKWEPGYQWESLWICSLIFVAVESTWCSRLA